MSDSGIRYGLSTPSKPATKILSPQARRKSILLIGRGGPDQSPLQKRTRMLKIKKCSESERVLGELVTKCKLLEIK
jgi:hypothetical protein